MLAERDPSYEEFVHQVPRAVLLDRGRHGPDRRAHGRDVGRGGRLLLRRSPPSGRQRPPPQGPLGRRPAPPLCHHLLPGRAAGVLPPAARAGAGVPAAQPRPAGHHRRPHGPRGERATPALAGQRGQAPPDPAPHAGRGALPRPPRCPVDLAVAPRPPLHALHRRSGVPGGLRAGRVDDGSVRGQLQLARPGLVPHQPPDHPGAAPALPVLRRRVDGRVPDGLRPPDDPLRGLAGADPPPDVDLPA